jgi:hypothetical protein
METYVLIKSNMNKNRIHISTYPFLEHFKNYNKIAIDSVNLLNSVSFLNQTVALTGFLSFIYIVFIDRYWSIYSVYILMNGQIMVLNQSVILFLKTLSFLKLPVLVTAWSDS